MFLIGTFNPVPTGSEPCPHIHAIHVYHTLNLRSHIQMATSETNNQKNTHPIPNNPYPTAYSTCTPCSTLHNPSLHYYNTHNPFPHQTRVHCCTQLGSNMSTYEAYNVTISTLARNLHSTYIHFAPTYIVDTHPSPSQNPNLHISLDISHCATFSPPHCPTFNIPNPGSLLRKSRVRHVHNSTSQRPNFNCCTNSTFKMQFFRTHIHSSSTHPLPKTLMFTFHFTFHIVHNFPSPSPLIQHFAYTTTTNSNARNLPTLRNCHQLGSICLLCDPLFFYSTALPPSCVAELPSTALPSFFNFSFLNFPFPCAPTLPFWFSGGNRSSFSGSNGSSFFNFSFYVQNLLTTARVFR